MKRVTALVLSLALTTSAFAGEVEAAQSGTTGMKTTHKKAKPAAKDSVAAEVQELKALLQQQQQQIDELKQSLQQRDQVLTQAQQQAAQAQSAASQAASKADAANSAVSQSSEAVTALKSDVSDLKANATTTALSIQEDQKKFNEAMESPLALHFKGITITPGGFLAAETVTRQRAMASDINTPFNALPFSASGAGHTPEFYGSGRQSRITLLAEGKLANMKLTGYFETDWLSAGVTSNANQSNSYTNRQRQIWGQVATNNGWTVTGGQMWSLATETRKGLDPRTEALPLQIDAQYVVGLTWARQFGMRVSKNFNNKFWLGMSVENPQVNSVAGTNLPSNYFVGSAGNGGGLYNATANYSFNSMPDLIFKAAAEPNGNTHFEVFGVVSRFRNRIYPNAGAATPSADGAFNDSKLVGGVGANARAFFANKKIETGLHVFGGQGVGRYLNSGLPDLTLHPDGTLAPLHAYNALAEIDYHTKKWDWYFDGGFDYVARAFYPNAAGTTLVGYGVPAVGLTTADNNTGCGTEAVSGVGAFTPPGTGSCTANTRVIVEGTFGFWYKVYNGPKGRIQFGPQYEYIVRNTWRGVGGDPNTNNNIFLTSFRYYLP
jgi:hypothetical protein